MIAVLVFGGVWHWRWLFWLMLIVFASSSLHLPATLLQIVGALPSSDPLWYSLLRIGVAVVEVALAVWMIYVYRHEGVWALGKKRRKRL